MDRDRFEEIVLSSLERLSGEISRLDEKLSAEISGVNEKLSAEVSSIRSDVSWIKGKLEGRSETRHVVLTGISIFVAVCAVVVAFLK